MIWMLVSNRNTPKRDYVRGRGSLAMIVGENVWSKFETKRKNLLNLGD